MTPASLLRPLALGCALLFVPATLSAASAPQFRATLAAPVAAASQEVIGGVLWKCQGDTCLGSQGGSRPVIACAKLVKKVGPVVKFETAAGALEAKDLAKCNGQ